MSSAKSTFVHAPWDDALRDVPAFRAFGDPDDGLRLTVLLADRLGREAPLAREEAEACKMKKIPWDQRLDALQRLLERTPPPRDRPFLGALIDPDALYPGRQTGRRLWKDRGFSAQRAAVFDVLSDAVDRGGWLVLRPNPRQEISARWPHAASSDVHDVSADALDVASRAIGADLRPVLAWLVRAKKALGVDDVRDVLEERGPEGLETYALMLAYEMLKPTVQSAGQRLSALRGPQEVNGAIGGFYVAPRGSEGERAAETVEVMRRPSVSEHAVEALEACGFLQPVDPARGRSSLQMPSPVRAFLRRLARLEAPSRWSSDNDKLGAQPIEALLVEEQLEVHYHAVESGSFENAYRTALYYGADLRGLAFRMSKNGQYGDAARVYQVIVEKFDPEDSYALEYLGYNLAREVDRRIRRGGPPLTQEESTRILSAYDTAARKARTNPLYNGRLLGFRAELGEPVRAAFDEEMRTYRDTSRWKRTAMGYFAKAVFDGLVRRGRLAERDELHRRWRRYLEGNEHFERRHGL
jgi:hypothetical protein